MLRRTRINVDPPICSVCKKQFNAGLIDPFHPYHQEHNKCEGCMTKDDWEKVKKWEKPAKPEEK